MRFATLAVVLIVVATLHPCFARLVGRRRLVSGSPGNPFMNVAPLPPQVVNKCARDPRPCPDGSLVEPDPDNDCEYPDCPVCCDKLKNTNRCAFGPSKCCEDGSWTCLIGGKHLCGGVETTNPSGTICDENEDEMVINQASCLVGTKTCEDGSTVVVRDPDNDCEWFPCPTTEPCCDLSTRPDCGDDTPACCEGGAWATCPLIDDGIAYYKCSDGVFDDAPSGVICKEEEEVIDQPSCVEATKECPDGSILVPDPDNNCEFPACPCCDPDELPDCNGEGQAACCGDGQWSCPIIDEGEAFYKCNSSEELLPILLTGIVCEVQDAPQDPMPTLPGIPSESTMKQESMSEASTAKCCNPNEEPNKPGTPMCKAGYQCCPDGSWACGVGDGQSFLCRNSPFYTGPFSEACKIDGAPGDEQDLPLTTMIPLTTSIELSPVATAAVVTDESNVPASTAGTTIGASESTVATTAEPTIGEESLEEELVSTTEPINDSLIGTEEPIMAEAKPQACSFETQPCRFGPDVGRDPNNNCEFLPCLTKAAAKQLKDQQRKERGGQKNPKKKRLGKRAKRIKRRKKKLTRKQAREWRKRVRAKRQQLIGNGPRTGIRAETASADKSSSKSSRSMKSKKG